VYVSISGFGAGAGAELPGYDLLAQALGGLMSITGEEDGPPTKAGVAVVDVLTGMNAVTGTLAALRARDRDGRGQHVEVNLMSSLLSALVNQASSTIVTGRAPSRMGNDHPSIAPYALYRAADRELVVAVGNDRQFAALARVLGRPGLSQDPRFLDNPSRVAHRDQLRVELEAVLAQGTAESWAGQLVAAGVPAGAVNSLDQALSLAERLGLEPVVHPEDGIGPGTVRSPLFLSGADPAYTTSPPELGGSDGDAGWRS
jgi:crotonobetainyl-CoA:carnitine CoA-transferase CaiB-like acyl-CoA transferase